MTTLHPIPSPPRFGLPSPRWSVIRDGTPIGQVEQLGASPAVEYRWRVWGQPFFAVTSTGAWWHAVAMVEWAADRPSGYRGQPMPAALRITRGQDGVSDA